MRKCPISPVWEARMIKYLPIKFLGLAAVTMAAYFACAAPKDQGAATPPTSKTNDKPPISVDPSASCIPSAANNFCKPASELTGEEKCWAKVLGTEAATACAAKGKVFNRLTGKCMEDAEMTLKTPCSEADVTAAFAAAGYKATGPDSIETTIATIKENIKTALGVDAVLDQCGETKRDNGKTVLIPFFLGKKFSGDAGGLGQYKIHAGKVCNKETIPDCKKESLVFPEAPTAVPAVEC